MKERPTQILYNGPMVRAVLNKTKTQTRCVIVPQRTDDFGWLYHDKGGGVYAVQAGMTGIPMRALLAVCPWGVVGDSLWVRETLNRHADDNTWYYAADATPVMVDPRHKLEMLSWAHHTERDYCPSIHMPRWASRITQTITDVRVERVQSITDADALAEGVMEWATVHCSRNPEDELSPRAYFELLWNSINKAPYCWDDNPFVWCISFEVMP